MGIFFWDFSEQNDIGRQWAMFILNGMLLCFTLWALLKTYFYHGRCIFQLFPLSLNVAATLLLFCFKLFEKGYQFGQVSFVIQLFTYLLFCYTFVQINVKVDEITKFHNQDTRNKNNAIDDMNNINNITAHRNTHNKIYNIALLIALAASIVTGILVFAGILSKDCDTDLAIPGSIAFATELLSLIPTLYYGRRILTKINLKSQSDEYIKERRRQIILVLGAYSVSTLLRGILLALTLALDSYFQCDKIDNVFILTADNWVGQSLLVLNQLNQFIPHLMIPIALYIVPVKKRRNSLVMDDTYIDDQEYDAQNQAMDRTIKQSLITRSISSVVK